MSGRTSGEGELKQPLPPNVPDQPRVFYCEGWFNAGQFVEHIQMKSQTLWDLYSGTVPMFIRHVVLRPKFGKLWLVDFADNMRDPDGNVMYVSNYYEFPNLDAVKAAHYMMEVD